MAWLALKMLMGSPGKCLALVAGLAFASLLMAQQCSIFCGVMISTIGEIRDVRDAEIWVMEPGVKHIGPVKPLRDGDLYRIRGLPGVRWAVPLFTGEAVAELEDGRTELVILHGLDDATLAGAPQKMIMGDVHGLNSPDAVVIDYAGYRKLWPGQPLRLNRRLHINDRQVVLRGICQASAVLRTLPIIYAPISATASLVPATLGTTSFVLVKAEPETVAEEVCSRIHTETGLLALTSEAFEQRTMRYVLQHTGIPLNFAITVGLGFLVGVLVSGQTLYLVTLENLPLFGTLKAIGTTNAQIVGMLLLQGGFVGGVGYGMGVGMAALFGVLTQYHPQLLFHMPWQVLAGTALGMIAMVMLGSLLSVHRVLVLEPAIVFRA